MNISKRLTLKLKIKKKRLKKITSTKEVKDQSVINHLNQQLGIIKKKVLGKFNKIDFQGCNKQSKYPVGLACTTMLENNFQFHDDIVNIYH